MDIFKYLDDKIYEHVRKEHDASRVPSTDNLEDYADRCIGLYERKTGQVISEEKFAQYIDAKNKKLCSMKLVYRSGDLDSYMSLVRSKDFISSSEHNMNKSISRNNRKILFRDTEFPVDENGHYIV